MKKYLLFGVLIFLITVGILPVLASGMAEQDPEQQENVYIILNQDGQHVQVLGGQSIQAVNGLERAETRARFMEIRTPANKPKDDNSDVVRKNKK
jgi:hypothetical protein